MVDEEITSYREKHWNELQFTEKTERMRVVVKTLERRVESLRRGMALLEGHSHQGGEIMIKMQEQYYGEEKLKIPSNSEEVYF